MTLRDAMLLWFIVGGLLAATMMYCVTPEHQKRIQELGWPAFTFALVMIIVFWPLAVIGAFVKAYRGEA